MSPSISVKKHICILHSTFCTTRSDIFNCSLFQFCSVGGADEDKPKLFKRIDTKNCSIQSSLKNKNQLGPWITMILSHSIYNWPIWILGTNFNYVVTNLSYVYNLTPKCIKNSLLIPLHLIKTAIPNSFFFEILCYDKHRIWFIWYSPRESRLHCGSKNVCLTDISLNY